MNSADTAAQLQHELLREEVGRVQVAAVALVELAEVTRRETAAIAERDGRQAHGRGPLGKRALRRRVPGDFRLSDDVVEVLGLTHRRLVEARAPTHESQEAKVARNQAVQADFRIDLRAVTQ